MSFSLKAGFASAALAVAASVSSVAAADLGGSMKDSGYRPMPQVSAAPAGPCYFRADVGYAKSNSPTVGFPTTVQTNTTNIYDAGTGNPPTFEYLTNFKQLASEATSASLENSWLGEAGFGCGSGAYGLRADMMFGVRGDRKLDAQPGAGASDFYTVRDVVNDFRQPGPTVISTPNLGDPLHTNIRSYTLMANVYKDLGNFNNFVPYLGAGVGAAYHQVGDVYFTNAANLPNRIKGANDLAFAWSLMAGVGYQVSDRAILDFGYRYMDMGKAAASRVDNTGSVNPRVNISDLTSHEFKVGLRYHFGSSDCCSQPVSMK
jgi:opacity protein-like surface antigen